jgi:hypothetical protein
MLLKKLINLESLEKDKEELEKSEDVKIIKNKITILTDELNRIREPLSDKIKKVEDDIEENIKERLAFLSDLKYKNTVDGQGNEFYYIYDSETQTLEVGQSETFRGETDWYLDEIPIEVFNLEEQGVREYFKERQEEKLNQIKEKELAQLEQLKAKYNK